MTAAAFAVAMPDELHPRHLARRLAMLAAMLTAVALVALLLPGLGSLRSRFHNASGGWLATAAALEMLSTVSYVVVFRAVFCHRMSWRISYQIAMSEQAANSLMPASGAGGLALGAWALHRGGMSVEYIGRRTVAFFLLTSLANVATLIVFAAAYAAGVLNGDRNPALTYGFAVAAVVAAGLVLALPALVKPKQAPAAQATRVERLRASIRLVRNSLGQGVSDAIALLRRRPVGVLVGSIGTMAFDIATLGTCFVGFDAHPALGVLVLGYLIGQLGGNIPVPGGIGGVDAGLIGTYALYHLPLTATTAAVLAYRVISLWLPALLGSIAFVQWRRTLQRDAQPAAICNPLAEPLDTVGLAPLGAGGTGRGSV